jgi:hypothetical protein
MLTHVPEEELEVTRVSLERLIDELLYDGGPDRDLVAAASGLDLDPLIELLLEQRVECLGLALSPARVAGLTRLEPGVSRRAAITYPIVIIFRT